MAKKESPKKQALFLNARKASDKQLEQAFTVLRDVFRKQVIRLGKGSATQQRYAAPFINSQGGFQFQSLRELKTEQKSLPPDAAHRALMFSVLNLQELVSKPRYSISGWKDIEKKTVASLQAHGYNITKENLANFGEYMEIMREKFGSKIFPSEEVAERYPEYEFGELSAEEIYREITGMSGSIGVDLFA